MFCRLLGKDASEQGSNQLNVFHATGNSLIGSCLPSDPSLNFRIAFLG